MIAIEKYSFSKEPTFDFSVLIPTWNNLEFAKNCIKSLHQHSTLRIQAILIVNEGNDGTYNWLREVESIDFIYAAQNIGICYALNIARQLVKSEYIVYANDDMYFLPNWDVKLMAHIQQVGHTYFMLSATMIEPTDTGNLCVVVGDYGDTLKTFREDDLLANYKNHFRSDWKGSTWPPNVIHKDIWDLVGGMSTEFSPGMYSDPDLSMKLYQLGVRYFRGVGDSLVYHFGSKSTKRIRKNKGRRTFLWKWGLPASYFSKKILQSGRQWDDDRLMEIKLTTGRKLVFKIKRILSIIDEW